MYRGVLTVVIFISTSKLACRHVSIMLKELFFLHAKQSVCANLVESLLRKDLFICSDATATVLKHHCFIHSTGNKAKSDLDWPLNT